MGKGMTQNISTNVFVEILLHQPKKIETNCNQPVVSPQLGHPFHMTCICWKLTLQIPPTSGNFQLKDLVPIPPQKQTPQLRYRNFEHLLVIQMKIKNLQIFLRQKGATIWRNSGLSPGNPTQHFRNYNFVQDVAFPQWMWFRKPVLCFATVKLAKSYSSIFLFIIPIQNG